MSIAKIFNDCAVIVSSVTFSMYVGNSRWVHSMEWSGQKDFVSSHESPFVVDGAEAGVLKSHGPLSFLKVFIKHFYLINFLMIYSPYFFKKKN